MILENIRINPGWLELDYGVISITGPEGKSYLNSQTTSNVNNLENGGFQLSSLLEVSGKLITSFIICQKSQSQLYILTPKSLLDETFDRIEKFHIIEDFETVKSDYQAYLSFNIEDENAFKGHYVLEDASISLEKSPLFESSNEMNKEDFNSLRILSGLPAIGVEVSQGELISNTYLDELTVDYSKGCFPGQETVGKINSRRGAAFKPVIIECNKGLTTESGSKILSDGKKVGTLLNSIELNDRTYLYANVNRELRIEKLEKEIQIGESQSIKGTIHYLPFLNLKKIDIANELYDQAMEYFYKEENEAAAEYFEKAINLNPLFEDAYESLGVLLGRMEKYEDAISLMEKLNELNPKAIMPYTNLSLYHMKVGNIEKAEEYKSQATLKNFEILGDEAEEKRRIQKQEEAEKAELERKKEMFLAVLEIDEDDAMANNGMGEVSFKFKDFEKAISYYQKAINADKKYSVAYLGLAKSYYQNSKFEEAKNILEEGIKVASKNGDLMPANEMQRLLVKL